MIKKAYLCVVILFVAGCTSISEFYTPYLDPKTETGLITLRKGEEPQIFSTNDIFNDSLDIISNHYVCIGITEFNGRGRDITPDIRTQCLDNGATVALYQMKYTNTVKHERGPRNYTGNTGYGGHATATDVFNSLGDVVGAAVVAAGPIDKYDYTVLYFVPMTTKFKFGVQWEDLTYEMKQIVKRNTGAFVDMVYKNTPAFYANILRGDVIIRINEYNITNAAETEKILNLYQPGETIEVELIRDQQSIAVHVKLE